MLEEWKQWGVMGWGVGKGGMSYSFPSFRPLVFTNYSMPHFSGKPCSLVDWGVADMRMAEAHPKDSEGAPRAPPVHPAHLILTYPLLHELCEKQRRKGKI